MADHSPLTAGFCETVYRDDHEPGDSQPIVQCLSIKKINAAPQASGTDRYRLILSDGKYFIQAMLATQLNTLVDSKELDKNTVIKLNEYVKNAVQGRKLIIVLKIDIVQTREDKIGSPVNLEQATKDSTAETSNGGASRATTGGSAAPAPARAPAKAPAGRPMGGKDVGALFPIEGLSPYQNKWTIKARVSQKSDIKHWSNNRGEGKLFNVTLMDESGEIRATGFNAECDKFFDLLQEGKVYFVTRARINVAKKNFSNVKNEYEISFTQDTEIDPCDDESVPKVKYDFTSIGDLADKNKDDFCDVIGVVKDIGEIGSVTSKATSKPFAKRDITLVDQSGQSVRMTLWGKQAETFEVPVHTILAFKGVKVGDFGGRSLSMFSTATMSVDPDIDFTHSLRGWWDAEGKDRSFTAYTNNSEMRSDSSVAKPSELKTIGEVKDANLGMSEKTDYFTTNATISFIKQETYAYPACANPEGCNKKVVQNTDNWTCEKCNKDWPSPIWRYILNMNLMDHSNSFWVTGFNEVAEQIMGISANDLHQAQDNSDPAFDAAFVKAIGKTFSFQMMAKQDSYNDEIRVRYQCRKVAAPNYAAESEHLVQLINGFNQL